MREGSIFGRFFNTEPRQETLQSKADRGNADAQFLLGLRYANGVGEAQDYPRAFEWYFKAAEQSHVLAQFNIGVMYTHGQGVLPDEGQAQIWFGRAARQQDAGAEYYLGVGRYRASFHGTPQEMQESNIEAYKWFSLAAALGYQDSEATRDTILLRMNPEDLAEARLRVDRFLVSVRPNALDQKL